MKWKLDENLGSRAAHLFWNAGHDAETVLQEQLCGASDETSFEVCIQEDRCLLTLDIDFADVLRFPPHLGSGIAVLRMPGNPSLHLIENLVSDLLRFLETASIYGRLWIVEPGRIRVHDDTNPGENPGEKSSN
jgi:predicted nuclease of predicted toxin-antitoxin system